ncbi:MAG: hypothetical protein LUI39_00155, partial [Lachnospiraceae bacterium]|nr:hypothetical protein [Lachnospiraceae bacterium]
SGAYVKNFSGHFQKRLTTNVFHALFYIVSFFVMKTLIIPSELLSCICKPGVIYCTKIEHFVTAQYSYSFKAL